jgi:hypothetical protein
MRTGIILGFAGKRLYATGNPQSKPCVNWHSLGTGDQAQTHIFDPHAVRFWALPGYPFGGSSRSIPLADVFGRWQATRSLCPKRLE